VEDDFDVRDALVEILESEGREVMGAGNGLEALNQMRMGPSPCLVLLDLMMPVMDGWQFRVEQLRDPRLAVIPVVLMSADARVDQEAATLGAAAYLRKPLEVEELLEIVARYR
jgi:CheY-like chemotaxis protein